jgi:hypothetical protein
MGMVQFVLPDPDKLGSAEPKDFPDLGITVPVKLADSGRSKKEWDDLIKAGLPVLVHDEGKAD